MEPREQGQDKIGPMLTTVRPAEDMFACHDLLLEKHIAGANSSRWPRQQAIQEHRTLLPQRQPDLRNSLCCAVSPEAPQNGEHG